MSRLEKLLSQSMRNKVLDHLDASSLSSMSATGYPSIKSALQYPINYDWREETDAEKEEREQLERSLVNPLIPPFGFRLGEDRYIVLDHETCRITRVISEEELYRDWNDELRKQLARKSNNELFSLSDINSISDYISLCRQDEDTGILLYNKGPLADQKIVFDEKGRVIIHPVRNLYTEGRKLNRQSKKSCKKRRSNTKRCTKNKK